MIRQREDQSVLSTAVREEMHQLYRLGGKERSMAPHVVYQDANCPHGCGQHLQAIDFRLEDHGKEIHDPLVRLVGRYRLRRPLSQLPAMDSLHNPRQVRNQ